MQAFPQTVRRWGCHATAATAGAMMVASATATWSAAAAALPPRFDQYSITDQYMKPCALAAGVDQVWIGNCGETGTEAAPEMGLVTPSSGAYSEVGPVGPVNSMVLRSDGALWFTECTVDATNASGLVGMITTTGTHSAPHLYPIQNYGCGTAITVGPDGNLWVPIVRYEDSVPNGEGGDLWVSGGDSIARVTPKGDISEFPLPPGTGAVSSITADARGELWFTATDAALTIGSDLGESSVLTGGAIGRITIDGRITMYPVQSATDPDTLQYTEIPYGITADVDGTVWTVLCRSMRAGLQTAESATSSPSGAGSLVVGRVNPDGTLTTTPVPDVSMTCPVPPSPYDSNNAGGGSADPYQGAGLAADRDRSLWITLDSASDTSVLRFDTATHQAAKVTLPPGLRAQEVATDPGGDVWMLGFTTLKPGSSCSYSTCIDRFRSELGRVISATGRPVSHTTAGRAGTTTGGGHRERPLRSM